MTDRSFNDDGRELARTILAEMIDNKTLQEPLGDEVLECASHGQYTSTGLIFLGKREIWTPCPSCEEARLAKKRQAQAQEQALREQVRMEKLLGQAAIPKRFQSRSFDSFRAGTAEQQRALDVAREFAENFEAHAKRGTGLVMAGLPGTGKSHLATAILQHIMPNHCGLYITCSDLIRAVRATWKGGGSDRTEVEVLREFGTVALLVIDEVGVQAGTDNEQNLIFDVLDRRYRDDRPTILLTNQASQGLKSFVGDRVYDRLVETARWVSFDWNSYRATARKELGVGRDTRANAPAGNDSNFGRTSTGT